MILSDIKGFEKILVQTGTTPYDFWGPSLFFIETMSEKTFCFIRKPLV
jgi:hypothetical protein